MVSVSILELNHVDNFLSMLIEENEWKRFVGADIDNYMTSDPLSE
jgi:hypothetical protein